MHRFGVMLLAAALAFSAGAGARLFSYYRAHKAWCDANLAKDQWARETCVNRSWCDAHWNEDRTTRISCDPFRSRADPRQPPLTVSVASLERAHDLTEAETQATICLERTRDRDCGTPTTLENIAMRRNVRLLPQTMTTARLAMAARLSLGPFPDTVVKIGIGAGGKGVMAVSWNDNGNGPRRTETAALSGHEIDHLLAALNRSDFWRLPAHLKHQGPADGEAATVEVTLSGHRSDVSDSIGPEDSVDLSVLVNEIDRIIARHWRNVPR